MPPRILLLQARLPDDAMREHERDCFVARTGLPSESIVTHNLHDGPAPRDFRRRCDALMVGGSGHFDVSSRNLPEFEAFVNLLREVVDTGFPTFASCFGFQAMVAALGGEVVFDPKNAEVGTFAMTLTDAGRADPLFSRLPETFMAQMGHRDRAECLGDGVLNLVASERCRFQALRVPGRPVWATQFHPELDQETNADRFRHYLAKYGKGKTPEEIRQALSRFLPSPETAILLPAFLRLVFGETGGSGQAGTYI